MVGAAGCAVPAAAPPMLEDPTPLARCTVQKSAQSPLVTEWPASEKAHLESLLRTGMVAVAYDGCELRLLETCHPTGVYAFHRTSLASDTIEITSVDELYAKLPLGAASLQGALSSTGRLAIDTTAVGQLRLDGDASLPDTPQCREATHVVRALSVGAFDMRAGGESKTSGGIHVGPAGGSSSRERTAKRLRAAGDPTACPETSDAPHPGCRAPLQLFLTPAVLEIPKVATRPVLPVVVAPPPPAVVPATTPLLPTPPLSGPAPAPPTHCDHLKVEVIRVVHESPRPLHLPRGGKRVSLRFTNDGDSDVQLPVFSRVTLHSTDGDAFSPADIPGLDHWVMPVDVPAHRRRQLDVIVGPGLHTDDIAEIRVAGVRRGDDSFNSCTLRQALPTHP